MKPSTRLALNQVALSSGFLDDGLMVQDVGSVRQPHVTSSLESTGGAQPPLLGQGALLCPIAQLLPWLSQPSLGQNRVAAITLDEA